MAIRYLSYQQIDKQKWDACISNAANGLVYAYSAYLDTMADHWNALILDDYSKVMPLTYRKKYGIHYLYQPYFVACLGVFGNDIDAITIAEFLNNIPKKFRYWDIYLNQGNYFSLPGYALTERRNLILDLSVGYEKLYAGFKDNIKRNIKRSEQLQCVVRKGIPVEPIIELAALQSQHFASISANDYQRFEKLYHLLMQKNMATTYGVYSKNEQLVASCVLFFSNKRIYYILVGNHPNGKTMGASHALINAFIKDNADKKLLLDFEGSDISSLAFFYSSFGATEEKYAALKMNRLPWLMKLFKK